MKKTKIDLEDFLKTILPDQKLLKFLSLAQDISKKRGEFLYFAGGVVRDYLLKRLYKKKIPKPKDLDLVLQGNLKSFLKELLEKVKGQILFESQFLTYKVKIILNGKEFLIDFITARKEIYEDVAKLPQVFASHFKDDILRRDFTINALIIGLSPPYEGVLIDLVEGEEDLKKGLIRPLYLNSFVDDPTRIFRGIRYKVRFGFNFSEDFFLALQKCFEKSALKKLSGTEHTVITGIAIYKKDENKLMTDYDISYVRFKKLADEFKYIIVDDSYFDFIDRSIEKPVVLQPVDNNIEISRKIVKFLKENNYNNWYLRLQIHKILNIK